MSTRTSFVGSKPVAAGATCVYKCQLLDENGAVVPQNGLTALTLSIVDTASGLVVNSVDQVSILSGGRGAFDSNGNLVITLSPADTAMQKAASKQEHRSLVIDWSYNAGAKIGRHQVDFVLVAMAGN